MTQSIYRVMIHIPICIREKYALCYMDVPIYFKGEKFGAIYLCCPSVHNIANLNVKITDNQVINIHIPVFDYVFTKTYHSSNGFTLRGLIRRIIFASIQAGKYDVKHHPEHYLVSNPSAQDFLNDLAITTGDIKQDGKDFYVSFQS